MSVDMNKVLDLTGTKEVIDTKDACIAPVESTSTASQAYAVGYRFWYTGKLYIATEDIPSGGTITPNTNCKLDVLGDDLTSQSEKINADSNNIWFEINTIDSTIYSESFSKNIYNKSTRLDDHIINSSGEIVTYSDYSTSDFIPVESGKTYVFSNDLEIIADGVTGLARRVLLYDANKEVLQDGLLERQSVMSVPNNCEYIRFCAKKTFMQGDMQLQKGDYPTPFEAYSAKDSLIDDITEKTKNLYDKNHRKDGYIINSSGNLQTYNGYSISDFIPVTPGHTYTVSLNGEIMSGGVAVARRIVYFTDKLVKDSFGEYPKTFTVGSGIHYIMITASTERMSSYIQVEESEFPTRYVDGGIKTKHYPLLESVLSTLPDPKKNNFTFTADDGLLWSDNYCWRYAKNNDIALNATSYKTIKVSDGTAIYSKNADTPRNCFSMTKVLSALVAVIYVGVDNLSTNVTLTEQDAPESYSGYVLAGETASYETLISSSLIQSDNNAADALARPVGYIINPSASSDSEARSAFFTAMGTVATEIGMTNTSNFVNAHSQLISTPTDYCKLWKYIKANYPVLCTISAKLTYTVVTNNRSFSITSTTDAHDRFIIPEFYCGKTGTGVSENLKLEGTYSFIWKDSNDVEYVTVEMGIIADTDALVKADRFANARQLINYAYSLLD